MKSFTMKWLGTMGMFFLGLVSYAQNELNLTSECSNDPSVERLWRVTNSTNSPIAYTWEVVGTTESGTGVAAPGKTYFVADAFAGANTTKISWSVGSSIYSKTKAGGTTTCTPWKDLVFTSMCSDDPAVDRRWRVRNPNNFTIAIEWEVVGTSQTGTMTLPAADGTGPNGESESFFLTQAIGGPNTTKIKWVAFTDGSGYLVNKENTKASGGAQCPPPVPPCYASEVISYTPGTQANGNPLPNNRKDPNQALGAPQGNDTYNFVSLGRNGGTLVLGFGGKITDGPGNDIKITETSFGNQTCNSYKEKADVYATQNGVTWVLLGQVCLDGEVDLAAGGLTWATQIKLVDATTQNGSDGYDIDGVEVLSSCEAIDNVAQVLADLGQFAPNCGFDGSDLPYDFDATKQAWVEALPTACRNPQDTTKAYKKGTQGILVGYRTDGKPGAWEIEIQGTCEIRVVRKMPNLPYGTALAHTSLLPDLKGLRWNHGWVYVIDAVNGTAISGRAVNVNGHTQSMCSGNFSASVAPGTEVPITWDLGASCFYGRIGYGGTTSVDCNANIVNYCSNYYITGCNTNRGGETMAYEAAPATDYAIYPNPTSGTVNLEVINTGEEATVVTILDLSGRVIYNESFNGDVDTKLDLSGYTAGVYLVRIQQGGQTFVEKLMLN
jgi:hypothetical protein